MVPRRVLTLFFVTVLCISCSGQYPLPEGSPEDGRTVFVRMQCYTCHEVLSENFPVPTASPSVPVVLGSPFDKKSRAYLTESIIAPSHRFATPRPVMAYGDPPHFPKREYENIRSGELSRMGDYAEAMTVRELVDLVAYLEQLQQRPPGEL